MKTEQITQITEAIKTLNLNLNSETTTEIVQTVMPYLYLLVFKEILLTVIGWTAFVITVVIVTRAVFKEYKKKQDV